MYSFKTQNKMALREEIKFILGIQNGIAFRDEKVLFDLHIDLQRYCLVTSGMELLWPPHAEPVAALHRDHQHLPSLSLSPGLLDRAGVQPVPAAEAAVPGPSLHKPDCPGLCHLYFLPLSYHQVT